MIGLFSFKMLHCESRRYPCPPSVKVAKITNLKLKERTNFMLMTIAIVLIILWILGLVTSSTMGGLIHILLVVAVVVILVRLIQGRRVL